MLKMLFHYVLYFQVLRLKFLKFYNIRLTICVHEYRHEIKLIGPNEQFLGLIVFILGQFASLTVYTAAVFWSYSFYTGTVFKSYVF